ncbi:endonuclease Q family protein [Priestia filamentosa]|uniref:endonuclease Q family protein n=1 Tax=Priestia filamentosa TaxID=1402861 RepID=UPI003981A249
MKKYYADLHIHLGRTREGQPVKITASPTLTLQNVLNHAESEKGLNLIGIIDCHVPEVLTELEEMLEREEMIEHKEGGVYGSGLTILLGSELEIYDEYCHGPIHVLAFMPTVQKMREFSAWLSERTKNITLSTQRLYEKGKVVQEKVKTLGGLFIPAHIFTPFKSLFGKGVQRSLTEVFDPTLIDAVELGLSSDTGMADMVKELHQYPFLTNSDAHSLGKIAREYNELFLKDRTFMEFEKALKKVGGRKITHNYGLNPALGKYHHTVCEKCLHLWEEDGEGDCVFCGHSSFIKGVYERLQELADSLESPVRPPYTHQVPLQFLPGIGPKTLKKLVEAFGSEMGILHHASEKELSQVVKPALADLILKARSGELDLVSGGGGKYGSVKK